MKIKIVGWSGINHSYSIIAENYVRGLMHCDGNVIHFNEYPYYNKKWKKVRDSIFDKMNKSNKMERYDITIRFTFPYNIIPDEQSLMTIVFITCEFNYITHMIDTYDICDNVYILTPSQFSKTGIARSGVLNGKIIVVPHSYEYNTITSTKKELRIKYNVPIDHYVYFTNSGLSPNKNVINLILVFDKVYKEYEDVILLIKGLDDTYNSHNMLNDVIQTLIMQKVKLTCLKNIVYIGRNMTYDEVSELYALCDCYISPSFAEGFNLPVLESMCHGKNTICTRGCPSDEFADDAYFIQSSVKTTDTCVCVNGNEYEKTVVMPNNDDMYSKMILIRFIQPKYNKDKYIEKYSHKNVGKNLHNEIEHILSGYNDLIRERTVDNVEPEIILVDSPNVNHIVNNIRYFSGCVKIYVITFGNMEYLIPTDNMVVLQMINRQLSVKEMIKYTMRHNNINRALYVNNIIFFSNIRNFMACKKMKKFRQFTNRTRQSRSDMFQTNNNIVICDKKGQYSMVYIANVEASNSEYIKVYMKGLSEYDEHEIKYVDTIDDTRLPYRLSKNKIYEKIYAVTGDDLEISDKVYIKKKTHMDLKKDLLREADFSIMTSDVYEKYEDICRNARITFIHEVDKMPLETNIGKDIFDITRKKIFVYPESIEYFFNYIYKFIKREFILYTFENYYTENSRYKTYDYNNYIIECIYV